MLDSYIKIEFLSERDKGIVYKIIMNGFRFTFHKSPIKYKPRCTAAVIV